MSKPGSENHEEMNKRRRKSESDIVGETTKLWPASLSSAQVKFRERESESKIKNKSKMKIRIELERKTKLTWKSESEIESQSVGDNGLKPTSPNWAKVKVKR